MASYLSPDTVTSAIQILRSKVHPFVGITFLACKQARLPVGNVTSVSIDGLTLAHMEAYHRLDRRSRFFFQPFRSTKGWVSDRYPSTGLQTQNTQTFQRAFVHDLGMSGWGFAPDYIDRIREKLVRGYAKMCPATALAIWLLKGEEVNPSFEHLRQTIYARFDITAQEREELFDESSDFGLVEASAFVSEPPSFSSIARNFEPPPDAPRQVGNVISWMRMENAAPAQIMEMRFGEELSVVTGDNGLGKSFLLESAWWAATGTWADQPILPSLQASDRNVPALKYRVAGGRASSRDVIAHYDFQTASWLRPKNAPLVEALGLFSRADGSFAVFDPHRAASGGSGQVANLGGSEVWNGRSGVIEGLIRDWVNWQQSAESLTFDRFCAVLEKLSPEDLGLLRPSDPIRPSGGPKAHTDHTASLWCGTGSSCVRRRASCSTAGLPHYLGVAGARTT